jgi:hypothetical protein
LQEKTELEKAIDTLESCQEDRGLYSCLSCDKFFDCEIRSSYVKKVYESMSSDEDGGFEF